MKRLRLVALAVGFLVGLGASYLVSSAHAQTATVVAWQENQYATHPPPNDAGQGLVLKDLQGWRLSVCGQNPNAVIAGDAGSLEAYAYDYARASWQKSSANLTEVLSTTNVSCALADAGRSWCHCQVYEDREVLVSTGRVYYAMRGGLLMYADGGTCCDGGQNYQVQVQGVRR